MSRLAGKTALVTAAAQGIGRATAELFVREGARVIATDIDLEKVSTLKECESRRLDARDQAAIAGLAREIGAVDVLFNCVGYVHAGNILECDEQAWRDSIDLNITPMYRVIRAFLPGMLAAGGGSIVNVASVAAVKGVPGRFAYMATKAAIVGVTKSTALNFVARGIRCNAICPGTVDTPSLHERMASRDNRWGGSAHQKKWRRSLVSRERRITVHDRTIASARWRMDDMTRMALQRRCFALDLKDDAAAIESYKRWHRPGGPPVEVTRSLREAGIAELDIYLIGNRLFMVMDSNDDDASGSKSTDNSANPHVQAWEALMGELQQDLPFPRKDAGSGKWQRMEHIYSLASQP